MSHRGHHSVGEPTVSRKQRNCKVWENEFEHPSPVLGDRRFEPTCVYDYYMYIFIYIYMNMYICLALFLFDVLATSKVIAGWVPTCDSAHSWRLYSAASLRHQTSVPWPDIPCSHIILTLSHFLSHPSNVYMHIYIYIWNMYIHIYIDEYMIYDECMKYCYCYSLLLNILLNGCLPAHHLIPGPVAPPLARIMTSCARLSLAHHYQQFRTWWLWTSQLTLTMSNDFCSESTTVPSRVFLSH